MDDRAERLQEARKEYQRKIEAGEVERTPPKNPKQRWLENKKSLRASVDAFCFECVCEVKAEITKCTAKNCPLYQVRPYQK